MEPGIHPNFPAADYHRRELGVVSNTALKHVRRSPAHYKAWVDGTAVDKDTPARVFGRAFHCALLEPDKFAAQYFELPKFSGKGMKAAKEEWLAAHSDVEPMPLDDILTIGRMVEAVKVHPLAGKMIRDGKAEMTLAWNDATTGLKCKSRLDYYVEELAMIVDVKTTENATYDEFRRDVAKYSYHCQDALYRSAALALDLPVQHFVLLTVEKSEPYGIVPYTLDAEGIGKGYSATRRDIDTLAHCVKTNAWPGYPENIQTIEVPFWAA